MAEEKTQKETKNTNDKEEVKEVPEKFSDLVARIEKMSVLELSELVKVLEEKFGVSSAAPAQAVAAAPTSAEAAAGKEEEKSSFNVELADAGSNKIGVIKAVREVSELGLKEAKDFVEGAPQVLKQGVAKEEAEEMKKKLEEAGATVTLK